MKIRGALGLRKDLTAYLERVKIRQGYDGRDQALVSNRTTLSSRFPDQSYEVEPDMWGR